MFDEGNVGNALVSGTLGTIGAVVNLGGGLFTAVALRDHGVA